MFLRSSNIFSLSLKINVTSLGLTLEYDETGQVVDIADRTAIIWSLVWQSALSANFDQLVADAEQNHLSYLNFVKNLMESEVRHRK